MDASAWVDQQGNQLELFIACHEAVTVHQVAQRFGLDRSIAFEVITRMCRLGRVVATRHGETGCRYSLKERGRFPGVDIDKAHASRENGDAPCLPLSLVMRSAKEVPTADCASGLSIERGYILLNRCDGYHVMDAHFEDGRFLGFFAFGDWSKPADWYCAWTRLPVGADLDRFTEDGVPYDESKHRRWCVEAIADAKA